MMLNVTAIIPAYNEAENIALVVGGLRGLRNPSGLPAVHEIIVADNNSDDGTAAIARQHGARVVHVVQKGYGNACAVACQHASTPPATCCRRRPHGRSGAILAAD